MKSNGFRRIGQLITLLSFMLIIDHSTLLSQWQSIFSDNFNRSDGPLLSPWIRVDDTLYIRSQQLCARSGFRGFTMYHSQEDSAETVQLHADINFGSDSNGWFELAFFGSPTDSTADGYTAWIKQDSLTLYDATEANLLLKRSTNLLANTAYRAILRADKSSKTTSIIIEDLRGFTTDSVGIKWTDWPNGYFNWIGIGIADYTGSSMYIDDVIFERSTTVGVRELMSSTPATFCLYQNYPNPFNPSTKIEFTLLSRSLVFLKVFDVLGKEVVTLISEVLPAGTYDRQWDAVGMPSGVYFYRLQTSTSTAVKKLVLLK
ncbi:MAG: T9SS type A sorting domain-containing protein [Bacteroidota bacterium]